VTLAITIAGSICAAAAAAVLAHRLTSRRDQANRRDDLRIQYLLSAYRAVADTSHRNLDTGSAHVRAFEQGLTDIQLLGSKEQAEMAVVIGKALAENGEAQMDDLLLSLRDDLRGELKLEPLPQPPSHIRVVSNV
jgi:capsule polysaccharide export protein KpsC/LpsZ